VDKAISDILLAAQELQWRAESKSSDRSFTYLINAYLHFMMVVCSLWIELECHVSVKAILCTPHLLHAFPYAPALLLSSLLRRCSKLDLAV
jgi:hypothetical protein